MATQQFMFDALDQDLEYAADLEMMKDLGTVLTTPPVDEPCCYCDHPHCPGTCALALADEAEADEELMAELSWMNEPSRWS